MICQIQRGATLEHKHVNYCVCHVTFVSSYVLSLGTGTDHSRVQMSTAIECDAAHIYALALNLIHFLYSKCQLALLKYLQSY